MFLTHPVSGQTIDVDPDHAGPFRSSGWVDAIPESDQPADDDE